MAYVHTRAKAYRAEGHTSHALSFGCREPYELDGVKVFPEGAVDLDDYDVIALHAANLRNHFRLLRGCKGRHLVFFWHGHEILRSSDYPAPYSWAKRPVRDFVKAVYDRFKLRFLRKRLKSLGRTNKVQSIFVSGWLVDQFCGRVRVYPEQFGRFRVIPNSVHPVFIENDYSPSEAGEKFVTIRSLDQSCYALDLVCEFARNNPQCSIDVFGQGRFFEHEEKPKNVTHNPRFVLQRDLPALLNRYAAAIMPTRHDSQGVMTCEMATFGIPVVSSAIPIAQEMIGGFPNVILRDNADFAAPLDSSDLNPGTGGKEKFSPAQLIAKELKFIAS